MKRLVAIVKLTASCEGEQVYSFPFFSRGNEGKMLTYQSRKNDKNQTNERRGEQQTGARDGQSQTDERKIQMMKGNGAQYYMHEPESRKTNPPFAFSWAAAHLLLQISYPSTYSLYIYVCVCVCVCVCGITTRVAAACTTPLQRGTSFTRDSFFLSASSSFLWCCLHPLSASVGWWLDIGGPLCFYVRHTCIIYTTKGKNTKEWKTRRMSQRGRKKYRQPTKLGSRWRQATGNGRNHPAGVL